MDDVYAQPWGDTTRQRNATAVSSVIGRTIATEFPVLSPLSRQVHVLKARAESRVAVTTVLAPVVAPVV
jgi:hypothetical protein